MLTKFSVDFYDTKCANFKIFRKFCAKFKVQKWELLKWNFKAVLLILLNLHHQNNLKQRQIFIFWYQNLN